MTRSRIALPWLEPSARFLLVTNQYHLIFLIVEIILHGFRLRAIVSDDGCHLAPFVLLASK
jgi:hypothetical protein